MRGMCRLREAVSLDKHYKGVGASGWDIIRKAFPSFKIYDYEEHGTPLFLMFDPKGTGGVMHKGEHVLTYNLKTREVFSAMKIPGLEFYKA